MPAASVAISPWVDLGCSGESFSTNAHLDYVGREHCQLAASHYLSGKDASDPALSPLFSDLAGLPPLLVQAGGSETLVDQIRAFIDHASAQAASVTYAEYPDMVHVWPLLSSAMPEDARAIEEAGAFIREHTSGE